MAMDQPFYSCFQGFLSVSGPRQRRCPLLLLLTPQLVSGPPFQLLGLHFTVCSVSSPCVKVTGAPQTLQRNVNPQLVAKAQLSFLGFFLLDSNSSLTKLLSLPRMG